MDFFGDNTAQHNLGQRSLKGGILSIGARLIMATVQASSVIILARLLSPTDYGLVSMVSAVLGLAPLLMDLGTRDAVIQQSRISPPEMSALFWITMAAGCIAAIVGMLSGPLLIHFYREPRLGGIALVFSLSMVPLALSYQHQALLQRAMMYRDLALIDVVAGVVGTSVAIGMAAAGWGYWSLAFRSLIIYTVVAAGVWWRCPWIPGRPHFSSDVRSMIKFGLHCLGYTGADFAGKFADRVAIGRMSGPLDLGFYQKACFLYENSLDLMTGPLRVVAMSGLSKLRGNTDVLWKSWSRALSAVAFLSMPAFGLLVITSQDMIVLFLGEKWRSASVLLSIFALAGIPEVIRRTCGWLHNAAGRSDRFMKWGVFASIVQILALFIGLPFGVQGIAWALVASAYLLFLPAIAYSGQPFQIGVWSVVKVVGPQMVGALLAVVLGLWLRTTLESAQVFLRIGILSFAYASVYLVIVLGVFRLREPLQVGRSLVKAFASQASGAANSKSASNQISPQARETHGAKRATI